MAGQEPGPAERQLGRAAGWIHSNRPASFSRAKDGPAERAIAKYAMAMGLVDPDSWSR
ncbi:MAG: hypothetical protein V1797_14925 [Pseudomonadota bacterium]